MKGSLRDPTVLKLPCEKGCGRRVVGQKNRDRDESEKPVVLHDLPPGQKMKKWPVGPARLSAEGKPLAAPVGARVPGVCECV